MKDLIKVPVVVQAGKPDEDSKVFLRVVSASKTEIVPFEEMDLYELPKCALVDIAYAKTLENVIEVLGKHGIILAKISYSMEQMIMLFLKVILI